ncbi:hypothetical protein PR048_020909 [Dryococelus australis]|uniref:Uncharacterized protein n=1 Tax=Dryococelus australis TaxID=614101 RepID=A0ABQ9GWT1_9NEOP|nr:hypothetical protein PR048_020909 [Dryococelus australis]
MYGDDTPIIKQHYNRKFALVVLQRQPSILEQRYTKWEMKLNSGKSETIIITKTLLKPPTELILLNQKILYLLLAKYIKEIITDKNMNLYENLEGHDYVNIKFLVNYDPIGIRKYKELKLQ